jgi:WD40 repeat protein
VQPADGLRLRSLAGGSVELFSGPSLEVRRLQHPEAVRAVAFGPSYDVAITGCDDGVVRIWDATEAGEQAAFDGHLDAVTCLLPSADGTILLSGSLDGSVAVWELDRPPSQVEVARGGSAVAVSANDRIAVGDRDGAIQLLDAETKHELMTLRRPGPTSSLSMSPGGDSVLAGYDDGGIVVWDVASGKRAASLPGHAGRIADISYNSDATLAASASEDGTICLWETSSWETRAALTGHEGSVFGVVFTPGGDELVSCGADGTVRLWSAADGGEIRVAGRAETSLLSVAVTPDGTRLAAGGKDGRVRIFALDGGTGRRWRRTTETIRAHDQAATRVAITPDGRLLLSASLDGTIKCWELTSSREVSTFSRHTDGVCDVAAGADGRPYSAGLDGFVWAWDPDTGEPIGWYATSSRGLSSLALSADAAVLAAGGLNGLVYVWNNASRKPLRELGDGHAAAIEGLAFNRDGSVLASVSRDATARLWTADGEQLVVQRLFVPATSVAWHPTRQRLAIGSGDKQQLTDETFGAVGGRISLGTGGEGGVIVWDADSGPPRFLERHSQPIQDIAVTPDGRIVTASDDASVRVWDTETGRQLRLLEGHRDRVWALAVSPDGSLVASGSLDGDVRLWDLASGESTRVIEHDAGVGCLTFDAGGTRLVTGSANGTVRVFDVATGEDLRLLRLDEGGVAAVAVTADAGQALCGTLGGDLRLWDVASDDPPRALPPHDDSIWGIAIARDGRTAVTTSEDGTARVWDLGTLEIRHTLTAHEVPLRRAAMSPDGSKVAVGSADYAVRVWDMQSGDLDAILTGHWSEAVCVAYDADGTTLYAGGEDGSVRRWERGEEDGVGATASWHDALVADYHPSGELLVVGGGDGSLRLWDSDRGELFALLQGHTGPVTSVHVHPGEWHILSGSMDGSVRLWDLSTLQERHVFTDNEGPVSAVMFVEEGKVILSASPVGQLRVRSTRTGRLLRQHAGPKRAGLPFEIPISRPNSDETLQISLAGHPLTVLAARPNRESVLVGYGDNAAEVQLVRPDTPKTPPAVDASLEDPYAAFQSLYRSVGLRVARDGPNAGDLMLV